MKRFIAFLLVFFSAGLRLLGSFLSHAVGVLTSGAESSSKEDNQDDSLVGGVLNYRTGKLDDGTDPVGWYERD